MDRARVVANLVCARLTVRAARSFVLLEGARALGGEEGRREGNQSKGRTDEIESTSGGYRHVKSIDCIEDISRRLPPMYRGL